MESKFIRGIKYLLRIKYPASVPLTAFAVRGTPGLTAFLSQRNFFIYPPTKTKLLLSLQCLKITKKSKIGSPKPYMHIISAMSRKLHRYRENFGFYTGDCGRV